MSFRMYRGLHALQGGEPGSGPLSAGGTASDALRDDVSVNSTLGLAIGVVATSGTAAGMNWFLDTPLGVTGIVLVAVVAVVIMPRRDRTADPAQSAERPDGDAAAL